MGLQRNRLDWMTPDRYALLKRELERLYIDCSYSAQIHFEAAKSAELFGKLLVFVPALLSGTSALLVALGQARAWGAVGAPEKPTT